MLPEDNALVIALVRAHLMQESLSYVPAYVKVRWSHMAEKCVAERVEGHWRRKPGCKRSIDALACVCKQPELGDSFLPVGRRRRRQ